jgi:folate-dependent phosphoribosylglycinamide formyltransferase PurN
MRSEKIVLLCRNTASSAIVYNYLSQFYDVSKVIMEDAPSKWSILKKRGKKLGWSRVVGQLLFQIIVIRFLKIISQKRILEILGKNKLSKQNIPASKILHVSSANDHQTLNELKLTAEEIIIVNGTRILSSQIINIPGKAYINIHAGITPAYRGVHGAYWAYRNNEPHLAGVTIHFIDKGIDTGKVIRQEIIQKKQTDNFITYPYLQVAKGLPELNKVIKSLINDDLKYAKALTNKNDLYSHPTIIEYLLSFFLKGIK